MPILEDTPATQDSSLSQSKLTELYEQMMTIRLFEERMLELFAEGALSGTTHTYIGQEATAVSALDHLTDRDIVLSSHRCHGHFLVREDDPEGLYAEVMGKVGGVCGGRGGSQHLHRRNFYTNGIQGGYMPISVGMALAEKAKGSSAVVVAFIGDGTLGEGAVYEALNMASLWSVPLLVVVENNRYAQTTPIELNLAGKIVDRARAFGISADEAESNDIHLLHPLFADAIDSVRRSSCPHVQVIHTYRLAAHSKGDDFRDADEIAFWKRRDPLIYAEHALSGDSVAEIKDRVAARLSAAETAARAQPDAEISRSELAGAVES